MRKLHVGTAQIHSGGTLEQTLTRVERQVRAAAAVGVEVLLFPEGALHGYDYDLTPTILKRAAEPTSGPGCSAISALAREHGLTILIGFLERAGDVFYNSQLVARPDGKRSVQRKHVLTGGEKGAGLTNGPERRKIFMFNGVHTAIIICADSGIKDLHKKLLAQGVEYRFAPTGGGGKVQDMLRQSQLRTLAGYRKYVENRPRVFNTDAVLPRSACPGIGFTAANALGPVGRRTCHQGHCMIVDNQGVMRAQIPGTIILEHQQDQMVHAELTF